MKYDVTLEKLHFDEFDLGAPMRAKVRLGSGPTLALTLEPASVDAITAIVADAAHAALEQAARPQVKAA